MNKNLTHALLAVLALTIAAGNLHAKDPKASASLEPASYPRWNKSALGTTYPEDGPIIEVYAKGVSDRYSVVADQTRMRKAAVNYKASCNDCNNCVKTVSVDGGPMYPDTKKSKKGKQIWLDVPYSSMKKLDPVGLCNREAETIAAAQNMKLTDVVRKGFAVKVDKSLRASANTTCKYQKGGFASSKNKGAYTDLDTWVMCNPNPDARSNGGARQTTSTRDGSSSTPSARTNTAPAPVPARAVMVKKAEVAPVAASREEDLKPANTSVNKPIKPIRLEPKAIENKAAETE